MKKIATLLFAFAGIGIATAQNNWSSDAAHSSVRFTITHMMIAKTAGQFNEYEVKVTSAKEDFSDAQVEMKIKTASINTGDENRDKHLQGADFFDAEKNPEITFKSSSFKKVKGNQYKVEGDLTMHGVTKKVTLDAVYGGTKKDPWGNTKAGFAIIGKINRSDFGMNYNADVEGGKILDNMVDIFCDLELTKAK
ncbi:MAG: hypothetical protein FD123_1849 [Bacteroidetes bacterium]|nr:MAG: hypothetical protein FD123_1849 [Bacteroidota bacterium]